MLEFAIDWHDGAAKTPIVKKVSDGLRSLGYSTKICEPFVDVNQSLGKDIYHYWKEDPAFAMERMNSVLTAKKNFPGDIVIYDRHWMSVLVQLQGTQLETQWTRFVPTFYMQAPIEKTISCRRFSWDTPWTSSRSQLQRWINLYDEVADKYVHHIMGTYMVLTREQPLDPIVDRIIEKIFDLLRHGESY